MRQDANAVKRFACACSVWLALAAAAGVAWAQEVAPEARVELEAAFEKVLKDPTNLDNTYDYAVLATKHGDYEAAITSYERLLLYNPNLPRVQAELGVLYFRLGSFDTAKSYFERAIANPDTPDAARQRVEGFLAQIREGTKQHFFSGSVAAGVRYQSNANFGPGNRILLNDVLVDADDDTIGDDDFNAFTALRGRYLYDVANDARDYFAIDATYYGARQFTLTEFDVDHFRLVVGPGYRIYPVDSGPVEFRPTMRATYVRLDDETYNFSYGLGADFSWQAWEDTQLLVKGFAEDREYYDTDERPNSDTQDGFAFQGSVGARHRVNPFVAVTGRMFVGKIWSRDESESYDEIGASAGLTARIGSPFEGSEEFAVLAAPWSVSLSARYALSYYEEPNLLVSADTRKDAELSLNGSLAVPVGKGWSLFSSIGYQDNQSNLENNEFDNFSATLGASYRF